MAINFGLVGCGGMAGWHATCLQKIEDVRVVGLCDTDPQRTKSFKEKYFSEANEFSDFHEMLRNSPAKLDAVVLVTPHTMHYTQAKECLNAGVHVLCEKPMVTNSQSAYDLWKTVKQSGKQFGITYQAPYTAEYQAIKGMRDAGLMGKVQIIQGWLAQGWLERTRNTWRQDPALSGGGQMYDSGAHVLNGMMWIMNDPVVEVACFYDKAGSPVDINGVAAIKFQNGAFGSVAIGGNSPGWDVEIKVQTDRMQVKTGAHGGWLDVVRDGKKFYPNVDFDDRPSAYTPHQNFVDAINGRAELQAGVRYGVLLSALMDALYESADNQRIVRVKPVPADI
ncbi:MAG TPA: Gfo/Idh/MocA family oxidoreductase [Tepidisphaeraceae bacterium]|nr:Gfo/Idh/MocA family oxidoreductase [Tepidisphaeraceae bacterium]